jgi:hypothetical protein
MMPELKWRRDMNQKLFQVRFNLQNSILGICESKHTINL